MATEIFLQEFSTLPEQLQFHVIEYIAFLKKSKANFSTKTKKKAKVLAAEKSTSAEKTVGEARNPGWGKDIFLFVAPDFDETPVGFEEYMPAAQ